MQEPHRNQSLQPVKHESTSTPVARSPEKGAPEATSTLALLKTLNGGQTVEYRITYEVDQGRPESEHPLAPTVGNAQALEISTPKSYNKERGKEK